MTERRRFEFHASKELIAQLDAWRSRHPDLPDRSKAARLLIQRGIEADKMVPAPTPDATVAEKVVPASTAKPWRDAPWNSASVQENRTIACNARINERLHEQLKWILEETGRAKREVIESALDQYLEHEIRKRGIKV